MATRLTNVIGDRGEKIAELALTDFSHFQRPLFQPGFLGDKWPTIDFYVELIGVRGKRPYFFIQAKATTLEICTKTNTLSISTKKKDIERLLKIPGPTYILGIHEPSKRVFIRSVHTGTPIKAITRISLNHELHSNNLQLLHEEVREHWKNAGHKPTISQFT